MEEFKEIDGLEGYMVSNHGTVINKNGEIIKPYFFYKSLYVWFYDYSTRKTVTKTVGHLVASHFIPKPEGATNRIKHIDGDPYNNHVDNLKWGIKKGYVEPETKKSPLTLLLEKTPVVGYSITEDKDNITVTIYKGEDHLDDDVKWKGVKDISSHFNEELGLDNKTIVSLETNLRNYGFKMRLDAEIEEHEDKIYLKYKHHIH